MESKSLKIIQTASQVAKILSKVVYVFCIVGAVGCLVGIISMGLGQKEVFKFCGVSIHGLISATSGEPAENIYAAMVVCMIFCIAEIFLSKMAFDYFKNECIAGTPFTIDGARELRKLGICSCVISLGAIMVAAIICKIADVTLAGDMKIDDFSSVGIGLVFIILSIVFQYGAEVTQKEIQ